MPDLFRTASALVPDISPVRVRFGSIVSVEADRTCTVSVGGGSVSGVRYAAGMVPCPGRVAFLLTDGTDLFAVDHLAADGLTLAPRAYRLTDQSIADATDVAVSWDADNNDAWAAWIVGTPTRITAPVTGRYLATAYTRFAANATGFRSAWILKNATDILARETVISAAAASPTQMTVSAPAFDLTKGDYVELYVRQNSGGALALTRDATHAPSLSLVYVGP